MRLAALGGMGASNDLAAVIVLLNRRFWVRIGSTPRPGCVSRSAYYSVPARYVRRRLDVRVAAATIEVLDGATVVARHARARKGDEVLVLDHYLEVLIRKSGALLQAAPLARARASGAFTAVGVGFLRCGAQPPTEVMVAYIDSHSEEYGVEPICEQLPIAPSTYYAAKDRPPSARATRDTVMMPILMAIWRANYSVYGTRKLWRAARRGGHVVAASTDAGREQEFGVVAACRLAWFPGGFSVCGCWDERGFRGDRYRTG